MRVLVACVSQTGHLAPVLPLAEAFAARGDEVIMASAPEAVSLERGPAFPCTLLAEQYSVFMSGGMPRAATSPKN